MKEVKIEFIPVLLMLVSLFSMTALAGDWVHETVDDYQWTGFNASMALDSEDNPHITCYRTPPDSSGWVVRLRYAFFDGDEWNISVVDGPSAGTHSSMVLDSSDRPHIVYRANEGSLNQIRYAHYDGDEWVIEIVEDDLYWESSGASIAVDSSNQPHVVYHDGSIGLLYSVRNGPSDWETCVVDTSGVIPTLGCGNYPSMTIDLSDNVHITYMYSIPYYCETRHAFLDNSTWEVTAVDEGTFSSIVTDAYCVPHISYRSPDGLKYAKLIGTIWETEIVDSEVWLERNSIALDPSGNPVISYFMGQTGPSDDDLKFAFYNGEEWILEMVYGNDNESAGRFNSVAVDSDGVPVIAFIYQGVKFGPTEASLYLSHRSEPLGIINDEFSESVSSDPILYPLYPNPVFEAATISFRLEESCSVRLEVFDISGHLVETVLDENMSQGEHSVQIDGLSTGVYFCRMWSEDASTSQRFAVIR